MLSTSAHSLVSDMSIAISYLQQNADVINAIQTLTPQTIRYLETWDTYARETFSGIGVEEARANEIPLVAYEAGRAIASLSWGITTTILPIQIALNVPMAHITFERQDIQDTHGTLKQSNIASLNGDTLF